MFTNRRLGASLYWKLFKPTNMNHILSVLFTLCLLTSSLAEGTRQVAPNNNTVINGTTTTDIAALHINNARFQSFAGYGNTAPTSRLHIHIDDPLNEGIYLGLSEGTINISGSAPTVEYEFRVKDPNGNIVYGPIIVTPGNANAPTWQLAFNGPQPLYPNGYDPFTITPADLASQGWTGAGDYYIEFRELSSDQAFLIDFWDITVFDGTSGSPVEKTGRIWSQNWAFFAINDFDFPNRPFNGAFYVCAEDPTNPNAAFITKVDFNGSGFRPAAFNVAFNSFGSSNTGNIMEDRKSVEEFNATTPEYQIFLNDPVDLCVTASGGSIDIAGIGRCNESEFCIRYTASQPGQVDILLDFDGMDGVFTDNTADILFVLNLDSSQVNRPICLDWDGRDGLGNTVTGQIPVVASYAQGIYHFPIYDAELLTEGLRIEAVRPTGPSPKLYYDDSNITALSGSGEPRVQLSGCTLPCHSWTNYTDPNIAGFGNLNTINSWWFSQQLVETYLFDLPAYMTCSIEAPDALCPGDTAQLSFVPETVPPSGAAPTIISTTWSGQNIIGANNEDILITDQPGKFTLEVLWENNIGDTCVTTCEVAIQEKEATAFRIDTLLLRGDTAVLYDEKYFEAGTYRRVLPGQEACDTNLTVHVRIIETVLHYDFDDCWSINADSTSMDYREFEAKYPAPVTCADVSAEYLRRDNPMVNKHSCTPGVAGSPAMCVSSLDDCNYQAGNDKSVVFEVTLDPAQDTAVALTGLCFYERAPEMYDWINGPGGPNNYPTTYGIRVLRDGQEIYREEDIPTTTDWTKETFSFIGNRDFIAREKTVFRFELLGYCLIGDTSSVTAWDLDELSVMASCISPSEALPFIGGLVTDRWGQFIETGDVSILRPGASKPVRSGVIGNDGQFRIKKIDEDQDYLVDAQRMDHPLNGVSTKDVIYIIRHLMGKEVFDDPFQYLAGDVNGNNVISISDAVEIRKLILGRVSEFDHQPSWRIGSFPNEPSVSNPWTFQDRVPVSMGTEDIIDLRLTGFKVGDVTDDAKTNSRSSSTRGLQNKDLSYEVVSSLTGKPAIAFFLEEKMDLHGMEIALDLGNAEMIDLYSTQIPISPEDYHVDVNGILRLSVALLDEKAIDTDLPLFEVELDQITESIRLNEALANEVYLGKDIDGFGLDLVEKSGNQPSYSSTDIVVFPNPFTNRLNFEIPGSGEEKVHVRLYDLNGRLIGEKRHNISVDDRLVTLEMTVYGELTTVIYHIRTDSRQWRGLALRKP